MALIKFDRYLVVNGSDGQLHADYGTQTPRSEMKNSAIADITKLYYIESVITTLEEPY